MGWLRSPPPRAPCCCVQVEFHLGCGSLLIMEGTTQQHWQHRVPKLGAKQLRQEEQDKGDGGERSDFSLGRYQGDEGSRRAKKKAAVVSGSRRHMQHPRPSEKLASLASSSGSSRGVVVLSGVKSDDGVQKEYGSSGCLGGRINLTFRRVAT